MYTPVNHSFTIKVGLKGSKLYYHVFVMGKSRQHYITDIKNNKIAMQICKSHSTVFILFRAVMPEHIV